jgi:hypothetical protein
MSTASVTTTAVAGRDGFLRLALKLDAVVTTANGLAYLAAAGVLDSTLGVPAGFLRAIGAFLVVFGAAVWLVGTRPSISRAAVIAIVAANALWVLDSVLFAVLGWHDPSTAGTVWTFLQAATVGGFAALQAGGLKPAA